MVHPTELGNYSVLLLWWKYLLPVVEHQVLSHCIKISNSVLEFWGFECGFGFQLAFSFQMGSDGAV